MVQKILVGIDFSSTSVDTARWAVSRFPGADIVLFHSIEKVTIPGYLRRELGAALDIRLEAELDVESNLQALAEELGIKADLEVRRGWSPDTLTAAAEELHVDLIVVAAHHQRVWPNEELGNTCRAIVRKSAIPVLVWRPIRNEKDKTILAALSLRDEGAPVAEIAATYAHYFSTRLLLLHALPGSLQAYLRAVNSPVKVEETVHPEGRRRTGARGIAGRTDDQHVDRAWQTICHTHSQPRRNRECRFNRDGQGPRPGTGQPRAYRRHHLASHFRSKLLGPRGPNVNKFNCSRCERSDRQPLSTAPFPTERGARIAADVCDECWEDWKRRQMLLINHYGLNVRDAKARTFLYQNLDAYLFGSGDESDIDESKLGSVDW